VSHIARVNVGSVNCSQIVDVRRDGALESARARARNVKGGDNNFSYRPLKELKGKVPKFFWNKTQARHMVKGDGSLWNTAVVVSVAVLSATQRFDLLCSCIALG